MKRVKQPVDIWVDENQPHGEFSPTMLYCLVEEGFEETGPCKVGIAASPERRLFGLQGGNWRKLKFVWQIEILSRNKALEVERRILSEMRPGMYSPVALKRLQSEWVEFSPSWALKRAAAYLDAINDKPIRRVA